MPLLRAGLLPIPRRHGDGMPDHRGNLLLPLMQGLLDTAKMFRSQPFPIDDQFQCRMKNLIEIARLEVENQRFLFSCLSENLHSACSSIHRFSRKG